MAVGKFLEDNFSGGTTSAEWWVGAKRDGNEKRSWKWINGDKVSEDIAYHWDIGMSSADTSGENCFSVHRNWGAAFCAGKCTDAWEFVCERYQYY